MLHSRFNAHKNKCVNVSLLHSKKQLIITDDRPYCCLLLETFLSNMSFPHQYDSTQPSMFQMTDHNLKKNMTYQTWDKNGSGLVKKLLFQIQHDLLTGIKGTILSLKKATASGSKTHSGGKGRPFPVKDRGNSCRSVWHYSLPGSQYFPAAWSRW